MKSYVLVPIIALAAILVTGTAPDPWRPFYASDAFSRGYLGRVLDYANRPSGGEFTAATDSFGPLVVREGTFDAKASVQPWSSWWYPLYDDELFHGRNGEPSPLEKYDEYVRRTKGVWPGAADYERTRLYDPNAVSWAGLCDAWSFASLLVPEPKVPVVADGIRFSVADQKALLLKTFDDLDRSGVKHFGQRNDGQWDAVYEDIYPDQLHRFLQVELFGRHQAFIMDEDAGIEIWNTPVYRAELTIGADPADATVLHVRAALVAASEHVPDPGYVGTLAMVHIYTYDLHGERRPSGDFQVDYGQWTESSRWDHPDYVMTVPEHPRRASLNPRIDPATVDRILRGE